LTLQTRGDVYRIAKNRIVEAKVGSEVADKASASIDADANSKRQERLTGGFGFLPTLAIEHRQTVDHVQDSPAGFEPMLRNSQRGVPESHDRIANMFIDGSFLTDDRVRERGKQPVHQ